MCIERLSAAIAGPGTFDALVSHEAAAGDGATEADFSLAAHAG